MARVHVIGADMTTFAGEARAVQVFIPAPDFAHCQFGSEEEEIELLAKARRGEFVINPQDLLGGAGAAYIRDADGRTTEIYGSVRHLAPLFRQIADAFEARLAELPA